jgi:hypothetical protein
MTRNEEPRARPNRNAEAFRRAVGQNALMQNAAPRPIKLGCFDVRNGSAVIADVSVPIAAEIDGDSGAVARVFTWPLADGLRSRPTALDILLRDESIMIASPAAGGIVEIDRRSGAATVIPLDADVGTLIACGDAVWAVARADWWRDKSGTPLVAGPHRRRAVVWEEPTAAQIARDAEIRPHLGYGAGTSSGDEGSFSIADWRETEGDDEEAEPATPVWLIRAGLARRIDVDLETPTLAGMGGQIVGVCRLPADPIVKQLSPSDSSVSWRYPGTVITMDETGQLQAVGSVPSTSAVICADHGRVWLLGSAGEGGGGQPDEEEAFAVREVLLAEGRVADPLDLRLQGPVAVVDGFIVDIDWRLLSRPERRRGRGTMVVRLHPAGGGDAQEVVTSGSFSSDGPSARVSGGRVWLGTPWTASLTVVGPGPPAATGRELRVELDCRPWISRPEPPPGLDVRQFEQTQLERLSAELLGGWTDSDGQQLPLIRGVSFDALELRGAFPGTEVVALFHGASRPGIQFGRRLGLYDELGNPVDHDHAGIFLMEDVESGGLPPPARCVPDAGGVVWF